MPIQIFCTISVSANKEPREKRASEVEPEQINLVEEDGALLDPAAFASSCTLHGLNHIVTEEPWGVRRTVWVCTFLLSLCLFLSQVWERVAYYRLYPHLTIIDEMDSDAMIFPAITFCNCNHFRITQLSSSELLYLVPLVGSPEGGNESFFTDPSLEYRSGPFDMLDIIDRSSHQLSDMMLACQFRGRECDVDDFIPVRKYKVPLF